MGRDRNRDKRDNRRDTEETEGRDIRVHEDGWPELATFRGRRTSPRCALSGREKRVGGGGSKPHSRPIESAGPEEVAMQEQ